MTAVLIAVPLAGLLLAVAMAYYAGTRAGRVQVLEVPEKFGLAPIATPTIVVPTTATDADVRHMNAAFLAAVRAGRLHLGRGPEIPQ